MKKYQQQTSSLSSNQFSSNHYQLDHPASGQPTQQSQLKMTSKSRHSLPSTYQPSQQNNGQALSKALMQQYSEGQKGSLRSLNMQALRIQNIDLIDPRIAIQVLELDLSRNQLQTLQNIEQFKSLNKLNLQDNQLCNLQEMTNLLAKLENLEYLQIDGNCFQEDERYISKVLQSTLRNLRFLDIYSKFEKLQSPRNNEYQVMSSPSQATTAGAGYSGSLQNIPELMKELSNFSNSMKPNSQSSGLTSATTQQVALTNKGQSLHNNHPLINTNLQHSSLINAKIGKNNVKSRRDSNEGTCALTSITNHNNLQRVDENNKNLILKEKNLQQVQGLNTNTASSNLLNTKNNDEFLDSFDMLDLSSDKNMIDINLQQTKDLQARMTSNLRGISNHCQILSNGSQERDSQLTNNINFNNKINLKKSDKTNSNNISEYNTISLQNAKKDIANQVQIGLSHSNSRNQLNQGLSSIGLSRQLSVNSAMQDIGLLQQTLSQQQNQASFHPHSQQQQFLQRIISHQQQPSSSESERSSVKSITTHNSSSRHSKPQNPKTPKPHCYLFAIN